MKRYIRWYHPILFGIIPVFALFQINFTQINPEEVIRPLVLCILFAILSLVFINLLIKNPDRAALITSLFICLVYSYGHIYNTFENQTVSGFLFGRHRIMIVLWLGFFIFGMWLIKQKLKNPTPLNNYLNIVGLILIGQFRSCRLVFPPITNREINRFPSKDLIRKN